MRKVAKSAVVTLMSIAIAGAFCIPGSPCLQQIYSDCAAVGSVLTPVKIAHAKTIKKGWHKTKNGKKYYDGSKYVTGVTKIGKYRYVFNSSGIMKTGVIKQSKLRYYTDAKGHLEAIKSNGSFYYANSKQMTSSDAYDYKTLIKARKIISKITNESDSKATKRLKAFKWVVKKGYAIHRGLIFNRAEWAAVYARDHFYNRNGDCHSDAAAFAYLAAAIGYKKVYVYTDSGGNSENNHAWCMINGRVFDPLFAEVKSWGTFYNSSSGSYENNTKPSHKAKVPLFNPKHAKKSSVKRDLTKQGLVKVGKNYYYYSDGLPIKCAWKTVKGRKYYFKSSGKAATRGCKIKGVRYVFNLNGTLTNPKKDECKRVQAGWLINIGNDMFRVDRKGRAVSGFTANHKRYCRKNGLLVCGINVVNKQFFAASETGIYNDSLTKELRKVVQGDDISKLTELIGEPLKKEYFDSCMEADAQDGLWYYSHIKINTFKPSSGSEQFWSIAS